MKHAYTMYARQSWKGINYEVYKKRFNTYPGMVCTWLLLAIFKYRSAQFTFRKTGR